jgi:hydrogenase-1 operon protein HyaE
MPDHPLIQRLTGEFGFPHLTTAEDRDAYVAEPGVHVLFIPGDPARNLETADVAVILPELRQAFQGAFDCAVIDDAIEADTREAAGVYKTPSLIFYREGVQIGALPKVRDWSDYMARITQILAARTEPQTETADRAKEPPTMPSDFRIPLSASAPAPSRPPPRGRNSATWPCPRIWPPSCPITPEVDDPEAVAPALKLLRDVTAACAEVANGGSRSGSTCAT